MGHSIVKLEKMMNICSSSSLKVQALTDLNHGIFYTKKTLILITDIQEQPRDWML
jgi:hypothetical protein